MNNTIQNLLKSKGYGLVAYPKAQIKPLDLHIKADHHYESLDSSLVLLFEPDEAPRPRVNEEAASISGQEMFKMEASAGINFLEGIFQKLKLSDTKILFHAAANKNLQLVYQFNNVLEDKVEHLDLDNYLSGAIPLENEFRTYMKKLKNSELYVLTAVLKSNSMTIHLEDNNGQQVQLEGAFSELAKANVHFKRDKQFGYTLQSPEGIPLVFAYKAVQILYNQKKWFEFWKSEDAHFTINNQTGPVIRGMDDFPVKDLEAGDELVEF
ncbi:MAG: hypothetical protein R3E32_07380 [Chitinophagales bacterium]